MKYSRSLSWEKISSSTISIREFNRFENKKKVAIFCGYVRDKYEFNYHDRTYQWLRNNDYYVILVMPKSGILLESDLCKACDVFIERENFGYDFGSYACGLQYVNLIEGSERIDRLLFVNDSFIGPFGYCNLIEDSSEFWGNTDSNQVKYHYQSYLFGFNLEKVNLDIINNFFFSRGDIYTDDKSLVIENFELSLYEYFNGKGLRCSVLHPISVLKSDFIKQTFHFISYPYLMSKIFFYIMVLARDVNPTHQLWLQLFKRGFPFIKKELLRDNPTGYPELYTKVEEVMGSNDCNEEYKKIFQNHL
ncbi:virulence protein [Vibrio anguillarum]|uniref:rhamnan synthesis F family protein n=1 Tax=Vibrio anguillarum TaxID=55601 RepID=UPI00188D3CE8|nr:rhamnan synthesis F family protein [Vibrio anguillarum]MBF4279681.1 virulence protein [Vibrio anguillarum]